MIIKIKKMLFCLLAIQILFITFSAISYAATCSNNWLRPSSQTMETEIMYATLTEYANVERYFSMKQGGKTIDIYYLRGALLVKGLDDSEIKYDSIFWLPMVFVMPSGVVSKAVPQGPCSIAQKIPFSLPDAEGEIVPVAPGVLTYKYTALDKNSADTKMNHIRGMMQFTPTLAAPDENANVKGFKLVSRTKPYQVIGSSDMPVTTLKELRRVLDAKKDPRDLAKQAQLYQDLSDILEGKDSMRDTMKIEDIIMAPEETTRQKGNNELYLLKVGNKWGYVNNAGYVVIEPRFQYAFVFEGSSARVRINSKWGMIDKTGRFIIEPQYDEIGHFRDGLSRVRKNGKVSFINETGKIIVAIEGDDQTVTEYKNGVASFRIKDKNFYIDKNGSYITKDQFCEAIPCYCYKTTCPIVKEGKYGLINAKGDVILNPKYDNINNEKDGLFLVQNGNLYGFIDKMGNLVIDLQFESANDFKDGLAEVKKNGKYGFIDKTGHFVIEPQFDSVMPFEDGIATITIKHKWGLIDSTGRYIYKPQFENVTSQGASFKGGVGVVNENGKWGLIDRTGKYLIEPQFDGIIEPSFFNGFASDFAVVEKDHKRGVIHKSGKIIIYPQYTDIKIYQNYEHPNTPPVFEVTKYPHKGYTDASGNLFVMTDKVCGQRVVKNGKGEITWPKNIKELCGQKN